MWWIVCLPWLPLKHSETEKTVLNTNVVLKILSRGKEKRGSLFIGSRIKVNSISEKTKRHSRISPEHLVLSDFQQHMWPTIQTYSISLVLFTVARRNYWSFPTDAHWCLLAASSIFKAGKECEKYFTVFIPQNSTVSTGVSVTVGLSLNLWCVHGVCPLGSNT